MYRWGFFILGVMWFILYIYNRKIKFREFRLPSRLKRIIYPMVPLNISYFIFAFLFGPDGPLTQDAQHWIWSLYGSIFVVLVGYLYIFITSLFKVKLNIFSSVMVFIPLGMSIQLTDPNIYFRELITAYIVPIVSIVIMFMFMIRSLVIFRHIGYRDDKRITKRFLGVYLLTAIVYAVTTVLHYVLHFTEITLEFPPGYLTGVFNIGIYNPVTLFSFIVHSVTLVLNLSLVIATVRRINEEHITDEGAFTLRNLLIAAVGVNLVKMIEFGLLTYVEKTPGIILAALDAFYQISGLMASLYSFVFILHVFTVYPNVRSQEFMIAFTGIYTGMITVAVADPSALYGIGVSALLFIVVLTAVIIFYAFRSVRRQTKPILKASMRYYAIGSVLSLTFLMIVAVIAGALNTQEASYILENVIRVVQVIYGVMYYIAFWQPWWFKNRYGRANSRADLIYRDAVVIRGSGKPYKLFKIYGKS